MSKYKLLAIRASFQYLSPILPGYFGRKAAQLFCTPFRYARPEWEAEILARASKRVVREHYAYSVFGEQGPCVLFVHGWAGRGSQFGRYVNVLNERGYRVILFDGPAHFGEPGRSTNIRVFANAIVDCQKEFGRLAAVVAHSFGGAATTLALLFGLQADKAVLIATPADTGRVFDNFVRRIRLSPRAEKVFRKIVTDDVGMSENEASVKTIAPKMRIPVLVVHDPQDREVNFISVAEIKSAWPNAQVITPERVGHYRVLRDAGVVEKVVEFIVSN